MEPVRPSTEGEIACYALGRTLVSGDLAKAAKLADDAMRIALNCYHTKGLCVNCRDRLSEARKKIQWLKLEQP